MPQNGFPPRGVPYIRGPVSLNLQAEEMRAGYESGTCFMAGDVSKKFQSHIHRPLEHFVDFCSVFFVQKVVAK
jgi:hypothetical protein